MSALHVGIFERVGLRMDGLILILSGVVGLFFIAGLLGFVYFRGTALLQFYQQEEYDTDRFLKWVVKKRAFDKKATLIILVGFLGWYFLQFLNPPLVTLIFYLLVLVGLFVGIKASRPNEEYVKKPLVMTSRVQRLFYVYMVLVGFYFAGILMTFDKNNSMALMGAFLFFFQAPPVFLAASNFILKPVEEKINKSYLKQARKKMELMNPIIIGITGSYGKTSVKHILAHILGSVAPTLATPGSVNTPMGIVRVIREKLERKHKYFIVEMGAYGPGSIARLCRLTPPNLGIITAVGLAHFERFKSLETVFHTKFELANDVKSRGGDVIVHSTAIDPNMLEKHLAKDPGMTPVDGSHPFRVETASQTLEGLDLALTILWKGKEQPLHLKVPLFGPHQASNILLAVAAALKLGIDPALIKASLKTMPQISHRLEVSNRNTGFTVIDDAYNSNPAGFSSALDLLETLKKQKGRAILLTPGMVEMGAEHDAQHKALGKKAAGIADIALVVGTERMKSFIEGFEEASGGEADIFTFKYQKDAEHWLEMNAKPQDVVLIENNLPDLYEARISF